MVDRILRVIKLDFPVFKDIEADPKATGEAAIVVFIVSVLSALGSAYASQHFFSAFIGQVISGIVGWVVWAVVTYFLARSMFAGKGTLEGMLRVLGYATAPRLLGIFGFIPCIGWIGSVAGLILSLIVGIMAIREGLDLDTGQAILVTLAGWVALFIVTLIFGAIFGGMAALLGAFGGAR